MTLPFPPPSADPIPTRDAELSLWLNNFSAQWSPATWDTTLPTQASLIALASGFSGLLANLADPAQRTQALVAQKDASRAIIAQTLRGAVRTALATYRANPAALLDLLALGVRPATFEKTKISAPLEAPILSLTSAQPGLIHYRLSQVVNGSPVARRKFPDGTVGIILTETWGGNKRTTQIKRVNIATDTSAIENGTIVNAIAEYYTARGEVSQPSAAITVAVA